MSVRARLAALALPFVLALVHASSVHAQALGTVSIDDVRVGGRGHHRVLVSVLDPIGVPVPGLEQAFRVELDGAAVDALVARAQKDAAPHASLGIVIDGALLGSATLPDVRSALVEAARRLDPADRLRVFVAGGSTRSREGSAGDAGKLGDGLSGLSTEETPKLYDALYEAARDGERLGGDHAGAILVLTRGSDGGSSHALSDVFAMARSQRRLTPVVVVQVGEGLGAGESDRLHRLADYTAGVYAAAATSADLPSLLPGLVDRALTRWVLTFDAPGWEASKPRHSISVTVVRSGERRGKDSEYATADALAPAWWRSPLPWLMLGAIVAAAIVALLASRRRELALLVHDHDDDDGVWYALYAFPVRLGGAEGNDIVLADGRVSRNHAVLERRGRTVELADLNSENGTFVNGERITRRVLADGDRISLGPEVHLLWEARG